MAEINILNISVSLEKLNVFFSLFRLDKPLLRCPFFHGNVVEDV
jgi:hypothetical protein